jgi:putative FmdB family regulatory protein
VAARTRNEAVPWVPSVRSRPAAVETVPCRTVGHDVAMAYSVGVPRYVYRCRVCGDSFERTRSMSEANAPIACLHGHQDTVKLLTTVAITGRAPAAAPGPRGGCCGGACSCGA